MSCEICPIILDSSPDEMLARLYEGEHWRATLRTADQSLLGTNDITAKRHVESLSDLTKTEQLEFFNIHATLERAIKRAFGAQVINTSCLMNLAFQDTEQPQPHVHWHLKPRYAKPVSFHNHTYQDPAFGAYLTGVHERKPIHIAEAHRIVEAIRTHY